MVFSGDRRGDRNDGAAPSLEGAMKECAALSEPRQKPPWMNTSTGAFRLPELNQSRVCLAPLP